MFDRAYLQAFRADVLAAVEAYGAGLDKIRQILSQRRRKDIERLKECLSAGYFQTQDAVIAVKACLQQMRTGFWVFQTGRSRLKQRLEAVVERYETLSFKRGSVIRQEASQDMKKRTNPLQEELTGLKGAYQRLMAAYETLRLANHALSADLARACLAAQQKSQPRVARKPVDGLQRRAQGSDSHFQGKRHV